MPPGAVSLVSIVSRTHTLTWPEDRAFGRRISMRRCLNTDWEAREFIPRIAAVAMRKF